jgi:hypothetical protein
LINHLHHFSTSSSKVRGLAVDGGSTYATFEFVKGDGK